MGYNSVADSLTIRVYLHSCSCYCLWNTRNVAKFQENLSYSSSRSSMVTDLGVNGKSVCMWLLISH